MREAQARITSAEFAEWQAYAQIEPFGEERADLRAAIVAATIANVYRDTAKHPAAFTPAEFMPDFGHERARRRQSVDDQVRIIEMLNAAFGGEDRRTHPGGASNGQR